MAKRVQAEQPFGKRGASSPPVFFPLVMNTSNDDFNFADEQFSELENMGGIKLSDEQRIKLSTLANFWIDDLRARRTARPKRFRERLEKIEKTCLETEEACQWNQGVMYHLVHWAMEAAVKDAADLSTVLSATEYQLQLTRKLVVALKELLPADPGRQRPFDDERRIIFLADIFENAGGKAVVYAGGYYNEESTANTAFRRFAQIFYSYLPAEDKREPGGFDDALRDALAVRRRHRSGSPR